MAAKDFNLELLSSNKVYGGFVLRVKLDSSHSLGGLTTVFAVFIPPVAFSEAKVCIQAYANKKNGECGQDECNLVVGEKLPMLIWLSGLTCTDENFVNKGKLFCLLWLILKSSV